MFQNDEIQDANRLQAVVSYARGVFLLLRGELEDETKKTISWSAVKRVESATNWIEGRLATIPRHEGPFRKGRGSAQELDALAYRALATLRLIDRALDNERKARACRI